jgi:hypothetical protein
MPKSYGTQKRSHMPRLLIEDLAKELGKDPNKLSAQEFRNYLILIDWALALEVNTHQIPYLEKIEIEQEQVSRILKVLVEAIERGEFKDLDGSPDWNTMDDMLVELAEKLGHKARADSMVGDGSTARMADYEAKIKKNAYVHSDLLTFVPDFPKTQPEVQAAESRLLKQYNKLKDLEIFTAKRGNFINNEMKNLVIDKIEQLNPSLKKIKEEEAAELVIFYLDLMSTLNRFKGLFNFELAADILNALYKHVNPLIKMIHTNDGSVERIKLLLHELMPHESKDKLKSKIGEGLSQLIINNQRLRGLPYSLTPFKIFSEVEMDKPIDRVILIGGEDLTNDEVTRTINMILSKHANETIVVTFDKNEIQKIDQHNKALEKKFTLNVVGHGKLKGVKDLNANLGPFRGAASKTGHELADLVNKCPNIDHLRITGCFTGLIKENADLSKFQEKPRTEYKEELRTFTMKTSDDLNDSNSPFVDTTVAINCWNNINKENREISMTVSPGLIEPDEKIRHMAWISGSSDKKGAGIKEICITTPEGPKKHRLSKK